MGRSGGSLGGSEELVFLPGFDLVGEKCGLSAETCKVELVEVCQRSEPGFDLRSPSVVGGMQPVLGTGREQVPDFGQSTAFALG